MTLSSFLGVLQPLIGCPLKGVEVALVAGQLAAVQVQHIRTDHV